MSLLLRAVDIVDRYRWRWLLVESATGRPLADHPVGLDPSAPEIAALTHLYTHIRQAADADAETARLGEWMGTQVLGASIGRAIVAERPTVVLVEGAARVCPLPLELSAVDGRSLARREDIVLVHGTDSIDRPKADIGEALRILAVFSQPTDTTALALRRERFALTTLVRTLSARHSLAIELDVLQYGVTRKHLSERMTLRGGPDLVHISGHGTAGHLILEHPDGAPDVVTTDELVELLRPGHRRLKLVVTSACESAATGAFDGRRWLGLPHVHTPVVAAAAPDPPESLARTVARGLECAVLAMRHPVTDEYCIALADELYRGLFHLELPVDTAVARAVPRAAGPHPSRGRPALSVFTPTLHGASAIGLALVPPRGTPRLDVHAPSMAAFPPEPACFVGRTALLTEAGRALAPRSGRTAVFLHGPAGIGKTACALELAYRRQGTFAVCAYWMAPPADGFTGALADLAGALERQLRPFGFTMTDSVRDVAQLRAFLPRLTELLEVQGLLLVLDGVETLLTADGRWRDPRWEGLVDAMVGHGGESRVVFTGRVVPIGLRGNEVSAHEVPPLSLDETALMIQDLPRTRDHLDAADHARRIEFVHAAGGFPGRLLDAEARPRESFAVSAPTPPVFRPPVVAAFTPRPPSPPAVPPPRREEMSPGATVAALARGVAGIETHPSGRTLLERKLRRLAGVSDRETTVAFGRFSLGAAALLTDRALYWYDRTSSTVEAVRYPTFPTRLFRPVDGPPGVDPTHIDLGDGVPRPVGTEAADVASLLRAVGEALRGA
ncbi:hypothetical protein Val02_52250 [Virgisporangium aliadipatigenens]|uniref:CHAT domain-containing protein n=1 Tax=Virgisporangium aliadipatigenens TaxID=741659 RepID=A0A8J4DS49_9ACTN|nr:CHAT domain-containing protein [Virgisporangium aliadipatigenens]GIJ48339.1 hypothetical protein Val02_52250 [Virgisporangium aliadipatigenens]